MNSYEKSAVEDILHYNPDGIFFFYERKFLKAAYAARLPFAHEAAKHLKELYFLWQRELKREQREAKKLDKVRQSVIFESPKQPQKTRRKDNRSSATFRRMKAAYFRWYHRKTPERMAVYIALKAEYKAEQREAKNE